MSGRRIISVVGRPESKGDFSEGSMKGFSLSTGEGCMLWKGSEGVEGVCKGILLSLIRLRRRLQSKAATTNKITMTTMPAMIPARAAMGSPDFPILEVSGVSEEGDPLVQDTTSVSASELKPQKRT